jgi:hypothetical protein
MMTGAPLRERSTRVGLDRQFAGSGTHVAQLFDVPRGLRARGMRMICVSHRPDEVFRIAGGNGGLKLNL